MRREERTRFGGETRNFPEPAGMGKDVDGVECGVAEPPAASYVEIARTLLFRFRQVRHNSLRPNLALMPRWN